MQHQTAAIRKTGAAQDSAVHKYFSTAKQARIFRSNQQTLGFAEFWE
jgi:hypothetical protein